MKNSLVTLIMLLGMYYCNAQTKQKNEEKIRSEIYADFYKSSKECSDNVNAITDFNGKTEFWRHCYLLNGNQILKIESHKGTTYFEEIYYENNGNLVFARETQNYIPKNQSIQKAWNCEFYIEKGKLISSISLGHGKTEEEDWNPEIIFEMYKKRLAELKKIKE